MIVDVTDFFLCGMPSELAVLRAAFPKNPVFDGDAKNNLATLVPPGCRRIISCGLGGGLSPRIRIAGGAVAITVCDGSGKIYTCDPLWNHAVVDEALVADQMLAPWSRDFLECPWYSSGAMDDADTVQQRSALLNETGAWGVDDESNAAAVFCREHELHLNVLRFCSDDASETLPLAARGAVMSANGSPNMKYLLSELVSEGIAQDAMLLKVGADSSSALAALQQCVRALAGPG
jgi:hypothetical protein